MSDPTPKDVALGYGWRCPYCRVAQDEGQTTGIYYFSEPVCPPCARIISAVRKAAKMQASA